jgi:hypothetical protein
MAYVKEAVFGVSGGAPRCCRFIIYESWCIVYECKQSVEGSDPADDPAVEAPMLSDGE